MFSVHEYWLDPDGERNGWLNSTAIISSAPLLRIHTTNHNEPGRPERLTWQTSNARQAAAFILGAEEESKDGHIFVDLAGFSDAGIPFVERVRKIDITTFVRIDHLDDYQLEVVTVEGTIVRIPPEEGRGLPVTESLYRNLK